jgi:hypothetical protein
MSKKILSPSRRRFGSMNSKLSIEELYLILQQIKKKALTKKEMNQIIRNAVVDAGEKEKAKES